MQNLGTLWQESLSFLIPTLSQNETSAILGLISTGVITSFIPLAIAILGSFDSSKKFLRKVGITSVIDARHFVFVFILLFLPLVLWRVNDPTTNTVIFILWIIGLLMSFLSFRNVYLWFTGKEHPFLIKYFKRNLKSEEMVLDWRDYWNTTRYPEYDADFFRIYIEILNEWIDSKDAQKSKWLPKLIETLNVYTQSGNIFILTVEDGVLQKLFTLRLKIWEIEKNAFFTPPADSLRAAYLHMALDSIDNHISEITRRSITEHHSFSFFQTFEKHINETKEIEIPINEDRKEHYLPTLLRRFYEIFFENIAKSSEKYDIWHHYFPELLKISDKSLTPENAVLNTTIMEAFLEELDNRIKKDPEQKYDYELGKISEGIFPNLHQPFWSFITMFLKSAHSPQEVINRFITNGRLYGGSGGIMTFSGEVSDEEMSRLWQERETQGIENTLKLIMYFDCGNIFSKKYTDMCLEIIEKFEINDDPEKHKSSRKDTAKKYIEKISGIYH